MNSPVEERLREALADAGATVDTGTLRPLRLPERRRFPVDVRMVSVAMGAVVLAGAAFAVLGTRGGNVDRAVATSPASQEMVVFLCTKGSAEPRCEGRAARPLEVKTIESTLKGLPQVESVSFTDQAMAYESLKKTFAHNQAVLDEVEPVEVPSSFRVKLKKGADSKETQLEFRQLPGIQGIVDSAVEPTGAQVKSEIRVFLCKQGAVQPSCGAKVVNGKNGISRLLKEGKGATAAEREALEELIGKMPEVEGYVFEDQATNYKDFQKQIDNKKLLEATKADDMPETFRVSLKQKSWWAEVVQELRKQDGVAQVVYAPCSADAMALMNRFGIYLPSNKVCPIG